MARQKKVELAETTNEVTEVKTNVEATEKVEVSTVEAEVANEPTEEVVDSTNESSIDDVINECTGKAEAPVEEKKEPWYIARLKRVNDYYNW